MSQSNLEETQQPYYLWVIDRNQCDRISELLQTDFEKFGISGTKVLSPPAICAKCGKISGFDDFISGALKSKIHTREFMINALRNPSPNFSPPHKLDCSICGDTFLERNSLPDTHSLVQKVLAIFSQAEDMLVRYSVPNWVGLINWTSVDTSYSSLTQNGDGSGEPAWSGGAYTAFTSGGNEDQLSIWKEFAVSWSRDAISTALGEDFDETKFSEGDYKWGEGAEAGTVYLPPFRLTDEQLEEINKVGPELGIAFSGGSSVTLQGGKVIADR